MIHTLTRLAITAALAAALPASLAHAQEADPAVVEQPPAPTAVIVPLRTLGDPAAPVTIDEYASFVCLSCADWHNTVLPIVIRDYIDTGQARLVYHDVVTQPIEASLYASARGLCSPPDRFFAVAQSFMAGLAGSRGDEAKAQAWYEGGLEASGLTAEEMDACVTDPKTLEQIRAQNREANAKGLGAYPAILVNGQRVADPTEAAMRSAILFSTMAPVDEGEAQVEPTSEPEPASAD